LHPWASRLLDRIHRALKQQFDPQAFSTRGRLFAGL
jgi:hypothetical protein